MIQSIVKPVFADFNTSLYILVAQMPILSGDDVRTTEDREMGKQTNCFIPVHGHGVIEKDQ